MFVNDFNFQMINFKNKYKKTQTQHKWFGFTDFYKN